MSSSRPLSNGDNGLQFAMEIAYYPTTADSAGYKLPARNPSGGPSTSRTWVRKGGLPVQFHDQEPSHSDGLQRFIAFAKTLSLPNTPILDAQPSSDGCDEWLRVLSR